MFSAHALKSLLLQRSCKAAAQCSRAFRTGSRYVDQQVQRGPSLAPRSYTSLCMTSDRVVSSSYFFTPDSNKVLCCSGYQRFGSSGGKQSRLPSQRVLLVLGGGGLVVWVSTRQEIPYTHRK